MPIATVADLIDTLRSGRLLEPARLQQLPALQSQFPEPKALARELVRRGWLTPYQVNALFQGRGPDLLLGSYVLLEKLGEGGMGSVYKARNWKLGQAVAVKLVRKERLANPDAVRRFHREIRAAAQLSHPNVVHAFDADEVGGTHFFAMEYVEGQDLARLVKERGPLPVAQACDYVRQAALGLQHAHERGLVHRDVKPSNLLLTRQGVVKVLDMGLARVGHGEDDTESGSSLTQEGMLMGTLDYIAPEQARNAKAADTRSDLYSLGCTLYYLLTARVPFPGGTATEKLLRHQAEQPAPVERLRPEVPPGVAAVVRKLMAKRPADRYQTPAEAAAALAPGPGRAAGPGPKAPGPDPGAVDTVPGWSSLVTPSTEEATGPSRGRKRGGGRLLGLLAGAAGGALLLAGVAVVLLLASGRPAGTTPRGTEAALPSAPEPAFTNSVGMKLVLIPAGRFVMGSPESEQGRRPNEGPPHEVRITRPFYLGAYEVTQAEYEKVMGTNPSQYREGQGGGPTHPVEQVTWDDAVAFCRALSAREAEKQAGRLYRLPTEAEWEYACRAGSRTAFSFGDDASQLGRYAWFRDNDGGHTHPVGLLQPNAWGLYDIHGNVWEWCADAYDADYYRTSPAADPPGPATGTGRVIRSGGLHWDWTQFRSANRYPDYPPAGRADNVGFRVACGLTP